MAAEAAGLLDWLFPGLDPLDQILMLILIVLSAAAVYVLGLAARSAKAGPRPGSVERKQETGEGGERDRTSELLLAVGIDRAMARLFYKRLREAIDAGKVRPALVSDECPGGTVAFDFARQSWVCVEKDGSTHPLGQPPAGERLELEDYEVGGDG